MKICAAPRYTSDQHDPFEYIVQIYSSDGRLLGESIVNAREHRLANIDDAEEYARERMAIGRFESSIVIVSSEVADSLDQVHIKVVANDAN